MLKSEHGKKLEVNRVDLLAQKLAFASYRYLPVPALLLTQLASIQLGPMSHSFSNKHEHDHGFGGQATRTQIK